MGKYIQFHKAKEIPKSPNRRSHRDYRIRSVIVKCPSAEQLSPSYLDGEMRISWMAT